ncbi:nuclear transcription factor Y subunit beta [Abeliophyllum distichum]|uniref:Nuclear transcription factor Y subunit beta n=1 Tax=Abeliophyllum distichum TaxID=126358 RepID=A0ABD1Q5X7_9LAMI
MLKIKSLETEVENLWMREESYWKQQSRSDWLKDGDPNTKYFHANGNQTPDEYRVDRLAADSYRNYKLTAYNHLKEHGSSCPYGELYAEKWQKYIDFYTSPNFVERLTKNKVNWDKAKYLSVQGSKSFSTTRNDQRDSETQQWSGIIESLWTFHTFWYVDEHTIANEVLGERRRHIRGVGQVLKDSSPSMDSTTLSNTPSGTSNQFCKDALNYDPHFTMYDAQFPRMERTMACRTVNL